MNPVIRTIRVDGRSLFDLESENCPDRPLFWTRPAMMDLLARFALGKEESTSENDQDNSRYGQDFYRVEELGDG